MRDVVEFDFARGSYFSLFVLFSFECQLSLMPLGIIEKKEFCSFGFCTKVWVP